MNAEPQPTPGAAPDPTTPRAAVPHATGPATRSPTDPRQRSVLLACFLSAMPGLGQVYVGYYRAGFVHALVVAATITILSSGDAGPLMPFLALFLPFFWLYNIVDAGRRAAAVNYAMVHGTEDPIAAPDAGRFPANGSLVAGGVLVFVGGLILLDNVWHVSLYWLEDWWPVFPIAFGLYLLRAGLRERGRSDA